MLALEIEKQLAAEAKKRRAATLKQNQATDRIILSEREKGRARDKAAEMVGANSVQTKGRTPLTGGKTGQKTGGEKVTQKPNDIHARL